MIELVDTSPGRQRAARRVQAAARAIRATGSCGTARASWPTGRATGTREHGQPVGLRARSATRSRSPTAIDRIDGVPFDEPAAVEDAARTPARTAPSSSPSAPARSSKREAQKLWQEGKPDEYFFLEVYGSAVVEHLVTMTGARLCAWAESQQLAVLPHYSPGYPEWDIAEQPRLLERRSSARGSRWPRRADSRCSTRACCGPKKSLLAVFGLTRHVDRVRRLTDLSPVRELFVRACQYRRAPYRRAPQRGESGARGHGVRTRQRRRSLRRLRSIATRSTPSTPRRSSAGATSGCRWTCQRRRHASTRSFRYEGTTCTQHGPPAAVPVPRHSSARAQRATRFASSTARPAAGDDGHTLHVPVHEQPRALDGGDRAGDDRCSASRSNDVLAWHAAGDARAGCYCEPDSRKHKWGLVLETIHFALARRAGGVKAGDSDRLQDKVRRTTAARRRRHGHAAHVRRARTGQLRRGVEPDASRAGAGHPAPLRGGRLGLHPHEHVRRLAASCSTATASPTTSPRSTRPAWRSRARRSAAATATSSATSARSAD